MPLPLLALPDSSMENPPTNRERPSRSLPPPGSARQFHLFNECPMSEIVVSHLLILRLLAILTNRRNQDAPPVERISSTTAFAPLNKGSTVVITSRR
jgi:hypothetical protein